MTKGFVVVVNCVPSYIFTGTDIENVLAKYCSFVQGQIQGHLYEDGWNFTELLKELKAQNAISKTELVFSQIKDISKIRIKPEAYLTAFVDLDIYELPLHG